MTEVSGYCRRVSFNNVHPDDEASSRFYNYSFNEPVSPTEPRSFNYSFNHKRARLPETPSKSILKNRLSQSQLHDNVARARSLGVSYHDLNDLVDCPPETVPRSELAVVCVDDDDEDEDDNKSPQGSLSAPSSGGRRKSYSGMTDEELMALDPQFNTPRTSDINSFKFDSQQTYYRNAPRRTSVAPPVLSKQVIYPSSNENNYPSISLTTKHEDYDHNISTARKLLTVLSGRKHTWNSLDWLLQTNKTSEPGFLQNGDYLIVAALVPLKYFSATTQRKKSALEDRLYKKCEHLLDYILQSLPDQSLCLKVTVEFILDVPPADPMSLNSKKAPVVGTKFMIDHIFKQYSPNLVILGNKSTNLNFKYPMRKAKASSSLSSASNPQNGLPLSKFVSAPAMSSNDDHEMYLIKLSSYVIKYSPVPVIVVGTSNTLIRKKQKQSLVTFSDRTQGQKSLLERPETHRKSSAASSASIESYSGQNPDDTSLCSSAESSQPVNMSERLSEMGASESESKFQDMLALISTSSLTESKDYLNSIKDNSKDPSPRFSSKVHEAYQSYNHSRSSGHPAARTMSNSSGGKPYKVKSMISYSEEEEKKNEKKLTDKRLKKSVSQSSSGSSNSEKKMKKKKSFLQKIGLKKS